MSNPTMNRSQKILLQIIGVSCGFAVLSLVLCYKALEDEDVQVIPTATTASNMERVYVTMRESHDY